MRADLEQQLQSKHPHILRHLRGDPFVSPLAAGLEIEDGWFSLLDHLLDRIEEYLQKNPDPEFEIRQVKQKFGTLRVYTSDQQNDAINAHIEDASQKSRSTCERCGVDGVNLVNIQGRAQVLCTNCAGAAY